MNFVGHRLDAVGWYKNKRHLLTSIWQTLKAGYPARKLIVIGVTGTDGKTTTVHLIYEILKKAGLKTAMVSTLGAFISTGKGEEFQDTGFHTTTPDATVLQPFLSNLVKQGITHVVLETTSHGLDQHRVFGCNFKIAVLTNLTHEHLDYHKTFEKYLATKLKLFHGVKFAVLNRDDTSFKYIKEKTNSNARVTTYSLKRGSTLLVSGITIKDDSATFTVHEHGRKYKIITKLIGHYNIYNILGAVGATRAIGVKWDIIKGAVAGFGSVTGRMEVISTSPRVIVDFAHTPNSLEKLLTSLARSLLSGRGRIIAVLGCAGERDVAKRPMMGEISARLADISVFTAEDPRSEDVGKIIEQMMVGAHAAGAAEAKPRGANLVHPRGEFVSAPRGIPPKRNVKHVIIREPDRRKAIRLAVSLAKAGDTIVICGKGHEKTMAYGKTEIPWSDQEEARKALKRLK